MSNNKSSVMPRSKSFLELELAKPEKLQKPEAQNHLNYTEKERLYSYKNDLGYLDLDIPQRLLKAAGRC